MAASEALVIASACAARRGFLLLFSLAVVSAGCGEGAKPRLEKEPDIDALRALPYVGYSARKADGRQGVVVLDRERSQPGLNLASYHSLCKAELFDERGRTVRSWHHGPCRFWGHAELLETGDLVVPVSGLRRGDAALEELEEEPRMWGPYLLRLDYEGNVVWTKKITSHHDVELTPEGRLLTLTKTMRIVVGETGEYGIRDNALVLLSLDGDVIDELSLYDLFAENPERFPLQAVTVGTRNERDVFHANSIQWVDLGPLQGEHPIYDGNNVLVSIRHQDVVAIVNWEQRKLIWMWGRGQISGPHDAYFLDNGHIMIFDNGLARGWSRVIELDPIAEEIVWEYKAPNPEDFYTIRMGSQQRLANGNTLLTNSDNGQVVEISQKGDIVWEYLNPYLSKRGHRGALGRTTRYSRDFIESLEKRVSTENH